MRHSKKFILFLYLITCTIFSYATDSTQIKPIEKPIAMQRTARIDTNNIYTAGVDYTAEGHQIQRKCKDNQTLIKIKHDSKLVYWGPPEAVCKQYGYCEKWGEYCPLGFHDCCSWALPPPCVSYTQVRWQARPKNNQVKEGAIRENMPSVLSEVSCASIETTWEKA